MNQNYEKIRSYMKHNPIATLGTVDKEGSPRGAIIYICPDEREEVAYFITKQATEKYKNINENPQVSLTIVNPSENSTLQVNGRAFEVEDAATIDMVMGTIEHEHVSAKEWLPPIAKLRAGAYVVVGVVIQRARLAQFNGMVIGDEHIFTNL